LGWRREEVARLSEVLEAAEIELDRRVIAREELLEALAVAAAGATAVTGTEAEQEAACRSRRCRVRRCRPGGQGCR
jgi:N-acetylglutamate synthase/N-acetylornithine aminotransferase